MKQRKGSVLRLATPIKVLVQRFAFLALIALTFALMMLGKADVVVLDRARTMASDAMAPILDALSRPAATVSDAIERIHEIGAVDAENAREALEKIALKTPSVILLDLMMPEMNGLEFISQLHKQEEYCPLPIVVLTVHALVTDCNRALEADFDDYNIKLLKMPRLIKKMETLLNAEGAS